MALNLNYEPNVLVEDTNAITREEWLKWRALGIGGEGFRRPARLQEARLQRL